MLSNYYVVVCNVGSLNILIYRGFILNKFMCSKCGFVYDESSGFLNDGILPYTKWEQVPHEWLCPECGYGKEFFILLEF